jgi:hypothetical protein
MKMKKDVFLSALALLSLLFIAVSCDKDEEPKPVEDEVTANIMYYVNLATDELSLSTVSAVYTDAEGNEQTEAITEPLWEKTISKITLPCTVSLKVVTKRKENPDKEQDSYTVGRSCAINYVTSNGNVSVSTPQTSLTIAKDKLDAYYENATAPLVKTLELTANGSVAGK